MTHSVTDPNTEVRLGLVLYGGVSLAIYINGVAQEFFNAVKGRGVYRLLKALTHSDIVVDIVSGSSAGGINGVLLSYALCNDRDFGSCQDLWRRQGDLGKLLRPIDTRNPASVLDGEGFFQAQLEAIFREMPGYQPDPGERTDPSTIEALDLFVTGTDYDGEVTTRFDSLGHSLSIKDHRKVFKLKYRKGRSNDFGVDPQAVRSGRVPPEEVEARLTALATLSRITATFPGAFPPTMVWAEPRDGEGRRQMAANGLLRRWGAFDKTTSFLDGGVLDNKPFSYTIRDIYYRTAERPVVRKLFYVEPDPERFAPKPRQEPPNFFGVVGEALVGIPGYESIADDLRSVDDRNAKLRRYQDVVGVVRGLDEPVLADAPSGTQWTIYYQARVSAMRDAFMHSMFTCREMAEAGGAREAGVRNLSARLVKAFRGLSEAARQEFLGRYDADFETRRLFFVTYYVYDLLYAQEAPRLDEGQRLRYRNVLYALNRQIQALKVVGYAIERFQASIRPPGPEVADADLWRGIEGQLYFLLASGEFRLADGGVGASIGAALDAAYAGLPQTDSLWTSWLSDADIGQVWRALDDRLNRLKNPDAAFGDRIAAELPRLEVENEARARTVIRTVASGTRAILVHLLGRGVPGGRPDRVTQAYERFADIDAYVFPIEHLSDLREKDQIEVVRLSPLDATLGYGRNTSLAEKLSGDALFHFGGFLKRSWRSNDILWGRLDAIDLLLQSLLKPEVVRSVVETPARRDEVKRRLSPTDTAAGFDARHVAEELFPKSDARTRDRIAGWLTDLLDGNLAALSELESTAVLEVLVRAAQREVLETGVRAVIQDAIEQGLDWGVVKREDGGEPRFATLGVDGLAGEVIKQISAQIITDPASAVPSPAAPPPRPTGAGGWGAWALAGLRAAAKLVSPGKPFAPPPIRNVGEFFETRYRVGSETVERDIPLSVFVQIVAHALIVLKNVVLTALSDRLPRATFAGRLFTYAIDYPLWIVYGLARVLRERPAWGGFHVAAALLSGLVLLVGVLWRIPGMVVLPLAVFAVQAVFLRALLIAHGWWERLVWTVRVTAGVAAVGIVGYGIAFEKYAFVAAWWSRLADVKSTASSPSFVFLVLPVLLLLATGFLKLLEILLRGRSGR